MKKYFTPIIVSLVMLIGILGITNPGRKQYKMFDNVQGRLKHDYFLFSVYQQYSSYSLTKDGKYRVYKRYVGVAMYFFEISPLQIKQE